MLFCQIGRVYAVEACAIHIGPILSGEKLVDNAEFKAKLFGQFPQAIGGEMEGAGLGAASGRGGTAWILVKSICDWGDGQKHKQHQPLAAAASASLVHHVLNQFLNKGVLLANLQRISTRHQSNRSTSNAATGKSSDCWPTICATNLPVIGPIEIPSIACPVAIIKLWIAFARPI